MQILDTSLRDGGHRTHFHFSNEDLEQILVPLDQSGIDYIEIGYRNGSLMTDNNLGSANFCDKPYLEFCQSLIKNAMLTVMVIPDNIQEQDLVELKKHRVGLLRLCIAKERLSTALPLLKMAHKLHLKVALNFVQMTGYTEEELDKAVALASQYEPDMIYFADSNGSILPEQIKAIYTRYSALYKIPLGFHAHDNIGLAQTNALTALQSGAQLIDVSLAGMGKGIGNLKTEFFIAYLQAIQIKKYDLNAVLKAANYVRQVLNIGHEAIELAEFIKGISDSSTCPYSQKNT